MTTLMATILFHLVGLGSALDQATQWTSSREAGAAITWAAVQVPGSFSRNLALVTAVGFVESRWQAAPRRNHTGCGMFQVLPNKWGRPSCTALEQPLVCADWAGRILGYCIRVHHGHVENALRCYNASPGREKYVRDVLRALRRLGRDWV